MKKAQAIVVSFHYTKKQYSILWSKQEQVYALLLSVLTQQGTQFIIVKSLLYCKSALYLQATNPKAQIRKKKGENSIALYITNPRFWNTLSSIEQIIQPIHEVQKMSKSDNSILAKVVLQQLKLESDLRTLSTVHKELMSSFMDNNGPF